jgi:hypothetical protein
MVTLGLSGSCSVIVDHGSRRSAIGFPPCGVDPDAHVGLAEGVHVAVHVRRGDVEAVAGEVAPRDGVAVVVVGGRGADGADRLPLHARVDDLAGEVGARDPVELVEAAALGRREVRHRRAAAAVGLQRRQAALPHRVEQQPGEGLHPPLGRSRVLRAVASSGTSGSLRSAEARGRHELVLAGLGTLADRLEGPARTGIRPLRCRTSGPGGSSAGRTGGVRGCPGRRRRC